MSNLKEADMITFESTIEAYEHVTEHLNASVPFIATTMNLSISEAQKLIHSSGSPREFDKVYHTIQSKHGIYE